MRVFKKKPTGRPRKGIYKKCKYCNGQFYCIQSRIKKAHFCSISCGLSGANNQKYKGGTINPNGYRLIRVNGKQVREHRYLMEANLKRKLDTNEEIHHINGNKLDNRIENLQVLTKSDHSKISYQNRKINNKGKLL